MNQIGVTKHLYIEMGSVKRLTSNFAANDLTPKISWVNVFTFIMILCNISAHQKDFSFRLQTAFIHFCDLYNVLIMQTFKDRNSYEMFRVLLMVTLSSAFKTSSISRLKTFKPI